MLNYIVHEVHGSEEKAAAAILGYSIVRPEMTEIRWSGFSVLE